MIAHCWKIEDVRQPVKDDSISTKIAILHIDKVAPNFTGDGLQKIFDDLICSLDLTPLLNAQLAFIFISVSNCILFVAAFLGNALILISLHKESSVHPSSKLLLCSLATIDLCVVLIAEPLFVIYFMSQVSKQWNTCCYAVIAHLITSYMLRGVSAGTLTSCYIYTLLHSGG